MRNKLAVAGLICFSLCVAAGVTAETYWIASAAHGPGAQGTLWRTDVSLLNGCDFDVTVELTLHTPTEAFSSQFEVLAGRQQIFEDVVAQLTDQTASGALEIEVSSEVMVTSRTYNTSDAGTFGQAFEGVRAEDGYEADDVVFLQQLREDGDFRTNIGLLNTGSTIAAATVVVFDRNGDQVGQFQLAVPAGRVAQENRPIRDLFDRTDVVGGYAEVTVTYGSGVHPYASVVDNRTGDPTTIGPKPATLCRPDILAYLGSIDGMTVVERPSGFPNSRFFELHYLQPVDHGDPSGPVFSQYMTLIHRSYDDPVILNTQGYELWLGQTELTARLLCNQLAVEHRFFGQSMPDELDWSLLTIEQAAADHHRIVEALQPIYGEAWINTGYSKGGMTAVYHRRFYPDDVDATVAYVAPISFGVPDEGYLDFLANVGTPECNEDLWAIQREALTRRQAMLDLLATRNLSFERIGGIERGFESIVVEIPFTFWQYAGQNYCSHVPETTASDQTIFNFIDNFVGWDYASDPIWEYFEAYYYQAHSELGYPAVARGHIDDLLQTDAPDPEEGVIPEGATAVYDPTAMPDIADWLAAEGERVMYIYGEFDPWTGGAFELGGASDSYLFVDPGGTHGAHIGSLVAADEEEAWQIVARWAGTEPTKAVVESVSDLHPPWRRAVPSPEALAE